MTFLTTISPTTNQSILTRTEITRAEISEIPAKSKQAFKSWRRTSLPQRQEVIQRALKLLAQQTELLSRELTEQMGRPIAYSHKEIETAIKRGEYLIKISTTTLADTSGEEEVNFRRFIRKCPVGPVLILFAWNVSMH